MRITGPKVNENVANSPKSFGEAKSFGSAQHIYYRLRGTMPGSRQILFVNSF